MGLNETSKLVKQEGGRRPYQVPVGGTLNELG